ncbi:hypothetical protein IC766_14410 [Acinetobacter seifertii]|uniref:hypothetical protein n=1 Tax=Acinetobacter seifertii TaxID=1530123 RepID=UPI00168BD9FA|nr:hypothetical protein [Acinetobacter seifertii]QNY13292.1 hypothetical protein IC766_14410 [Acinetobacter seifertii]
MKPEQFIREFGVEKAREVISTGANTYMFLPKGREEYVQLSIKDLKRLMESLDLINSLGGLKASRSEAHKDCFTYDQPLLAAIADHESIYGGGDV